MKIPCPFAVSYTHLDVYKRQLIKRILYIGVPNGLENSMFQLGKIMLLSLVSGFGTAAIAANAVGNTLATFMVLPGMALGFAVITVISRCIGAGDYEQARYFTKKLLKITYLSMLVTNIPVSYTHLHPDTDR